MQIYRSQLWALQLRSVYRYLFFYCKSRKNLYQYCKSSKTSITSHARILIRFCKLCTLCLIVKQIKPKKNIIIMFIVVGPLIMLYLPKLPKSMLPESEEWSHPAIWWGYAAVLVASQSYYGMRVLKLRPKTRLSVFQNHFYALSFQWRSLLYIWPGCWKQSADGQAIDNIPIAKWLEVCTNHWELLRSSTYWNLNFKFCKYACQLLSIQTDVLKKPTTSQCNAPIQGYYHSKHGPAVKTTIRMQVSYVNGALSSGPQALILNSLLLPANCESLQAWFD